MATASQHAGKMMIALLAGSSGILTFAYPDWRLPLQAQTYLSTLTITADTTLDADHQGNIVIAEDEVTLDCNHHTIAGAGAGSGNGVELTGRIGARIFNCRVTAFDRGFFLVGAIANILRGNEAFGNVEEGFELEKSQGNLFIENASNDNMRDGFDLDDSDGNTFILNIANRNGGNGYELDRSNHNLFDRNEALGNGTEDERSGFSIDGSMGNSFLDNIANNNMRNGFRIDQSSDNTFINNVATGNVGQETGRGRLAPADCRMVGSARIVGGNLRQQGDLVTIVGGELATRDDPFEFSLRNQFLDGLGEDLDNAFAIDRCVFRPRHVERPGRPD